MKQKEIFLALVGVGIIAAIILFTVYSSAWQIAPEDVQEEITEEAIEVPRHPLTGEPLEMELETLPQVFGVMVENAADAWPLVGLDEAFLVIEAPVEGGIPRFISFFSEESEVEKVGPVRSARPYYLDWNAALQGVYAHVGGSPEALNILSDLYASYDLNQFYQSEYFYRVNSGGRYAPHNVYTDAELLTSSLEELDLETPIYTAWLYKDDEPTPDDKPSVHIDFANSSYYDVDWQYQHEQNLYLRYQAGEIMEMENGAVIEANVVLVLATDVRSIDAVDRKNIVTLGQGDGYLYQDGQSTTIRWRKDAEDDRMRFYNEDGDEVRLNAGVTWIEIVSSLSQAQSVK